MFWITCYRGFGTKIFLWLILQYLFTVCFSLDIYVTSHGDDITGNGSYLFPFRTTRRGISALQTECSILHGGCFLGATLFLSSDLNHDEIYEPIILSNVISSPETRIQILGLETSNIKQPAEISGAVYLVPSVINSSDPMLSYFPSSIRSSLLVAALPSSWNPNIGSELLWKKKPQLEARWPNDPVALSWATGNTTLGAQQGGGCNDIKRDVVNPFDEPYLCTGFARSSPLENWTWDHITASSSAPFADWTWKGFWRVQGLFTYDWAGGESIVQEFIPSNRSIVFTRDSWNSQGYWGGCRYFAIGAPEALDSPGEYFIDTDRRTLYWLPPPNSTIGTTDLSLTLATSLLVISNSSFVTISDLSFWGCTKECIMIINSTFINFDSNIVQSAGIRAIDAHFALNSNVNISNNIIAHTGDDSIWILGGDSNTLTRSNVVASNNLIMNFGRLSFAFNPGIGVDGVGSIADHNLIIGGPACGLMFGGALQQITYNIIVDSLRQTFDMGVICTGPRDWTQSAVNLSYNALLRNGYTPMLSNHVSDPLRNGFYLDYGNFGHTIHGSVVWQPIHPSTPISSLINRSFSTVSFAAYNHGGRNFIVNNSILVDINGVEANGGGLEGGDKAQLQNGSHYYTSLMQCGGGSGWGWKNPPCSTLLPQLEFLDGYVSSNCSSKPSCPPAPFNNSITYCIALTENLNGTFFQGPIENITATLHSNLVDVDPLFTSGALFRDEMDFSLLPTSPARQIGFQQLDMNTWGPLWLQGKWRQLLRALVPWAVCPSGFEKNCINTTHEFVNASSWSISEWSRLLKEGRK
jgi:hypothetical protein